ncbi:MAG: hypothetical protein JO108_31455 [Acidobacteriaceae bacterium]|nr:hypothetical protein [Acidobacteriaceae bacterium]
MSSQVQDLAATRTPARSLLEQAIQASPDPERAAQLLDEFARLHPSAWSKVGSHLQSVTELAFLAGVSHFLSDEVLRHPEWLYGELSEHQTSARLGEFLATRNVSDPASLNLALFRRKELLRIALDDALYGDPVARTTERLSDLADAIVSHALDTAIAELQLRHGRPVTEAGEPASFAVIALGKLGGRELNYSSDIDLTFLYSGNGATSGPHVITNREFFKKVGNQLTTTLSSYTPAGLCYRIDLRLRPEGTLGEVCLSLAAAKDYYERRARDWELQMLIKARVCAGDVALGEALLDSVESAIYSTSLDFSTIESMSATRERIGEKLARKRLRKDEIDIKLAPGGIRDIEFLVQCLQRLHGGRENWVRHGGTLLALERLHDKGLLSESEYSQLVNAYKFLRHLEHRLQLEDDRQTHAVPLQPASLERLARRMPSLYGLDRLESNLPSKLLGTLNAHLENVAGIYDRIVHAQRPLHYAPQAYVPVMSEVLLPNPASKEHESPPEAALSDSVPSSAAARVIRLSPYLAEQVRLQPELIDEVQRVIDFPSRRWAFESLSAPLNDINGLRRFFQRELFRIEAASICLAEPIFQTLDHTSALAEFVIARAYRIARENAVSHALAHRRPDKSFSEPQGDMMLIALGRLGMREFDLASDADLLFVIPDSESERHQFWTRVAEHVIEILTGYAVGPVLCIDTRLRPNGREGQLVQTESKYVEYFSRHTEAWEGIAYMKARGVAGDTERATRFLGDLQQVDWRRHGQDGRSKQTLRHMRMRLQREGGTATPLKAGEGGYYDADFILMYLRLKGAGLFFKSLNTPERIDIVEKMGHLQRKDAEFLLQATTFYRALDHAIRIVTGRAEERLPQGEEDRERVAELMRLWVDNSLTAASLEGNLAHLQNQMRRLFETVFA